jgi:putative transposase
MKRSKFSQEQVAYALRQAETGTAVGDVCRQLGISEATFYAWKALRPLGRPRGAAGAAARGRECTPEAPGRGPHPRQAHAGGGAPAQKLTPTRRRELARWFHGTFQIAIRRACGLAQLSRTAWYRPRRAKDQAALRLRIRELARPRLRFGYFWIWVLL